MSDKREGYTWFEKCWRRINVDMHIPDWDPIFFAKLDPVRYVELMKRGGAKSIVIFANSHVGLCAYPTRTGKMHEGLKGRDFFGEVVEISHQQGMAVVGYYSLIYNNWAYIKYPDWRILPGGCQQTGRYGLCCPNSPYRQFALEQISEICSGYDCDGIFFDMTFWPGICYCPYCIARYHKETGQEPPRVIDWCKPEWVRFQRAREKWLDEFAHLVTERVRSMRPDMTVTHQTSPLVGGDWRCGVPFSVAEHCDYLSGDFYGETAEQSIACKIFHSLSAKRPFEIWTSRCLDLIDHVTMKSPQRLETQAFVAVAHSSAFIFTDAVDPDGSLNDGVYTQIRSVFDKFAPYESELGGELCADVAVYTNYESRFDPADNGMDITQVKPGIRRVPHRDAVLGACRSLQTAHIPFTIITNRNLPTLYNYQVLVLPDVLAMNEEEIESVRRFVSSGGSLYASYRTSINKADGTSSGDFMLADVFGVSAGVQKADKLTFFTPADEVFKNYIAPQDHMIHPDCQLSIVAKTARVIATRTLPYTDPDKGSIFGNSFSSIHSNPPGPAGKEPAIVLNRFGAGRVCYAAGALEAVGYDVNRKVFENLIRSLLHHATWFEAETHEAVEVILIHQAERKRLIVNLLMTDPKLIGSRVDAHLRIRIPADKAPVKMLQLPENKSIPHTIRNGYMELQINGIGLFTMLAFEYK